MNRKQFGFLEGSSIELAKYSLFKAIKNLQNRRVAKNYSIIFIDFINAYDRVDHRILF